jgi:hypothetical protein
MMRADYDSTGNTIAIYLAEIDHVDHGEPIGEPPLGVVAVADDQPVVVDLLSPDRGVEVPLGIVAERYDLDVEALVAAALAARAAPDRVVTIDVGTHASA